MVLDALKTKVPFEPTGWTLAVSLLQLLMLGLAASRSTGGFEPVEPIEELRGQRPGVVALRLEAAEYRKLSVAVADLAVDDGGLLVAPGSDAVVLRLLGPHALLEDGEGLGVPAVSLVGGDGVAP